MKHLWWARLAQLGLLLVWACMWLVQGCGPGPGYGIRPKNRKLKPMRYKEFSPNLSENNLGASGRAEGHISRSHPRFLELVHNFNPDIVFKDEENTGADRIMTRRCKDCLNRLAIAVMNQWPGVRLRVTEAWDEDGNHPQGSLHYEGRAVDITTDDKDTKKYGLLAQLAVDAGFDWVHYETKHRIHCSVKSDNSVTVERGGCFPGWAKVTVVGGRQITLSSLTADDRIMALSETGQVVYSQVLLFLHREPKRWSTFLFLETEDGSAVSLTPDHLIFLASHCRNDISEYKVQFASRARTGDCVLIIKAGGQPRPSQIISVSVAESVGVYAPLTEAGTLFVDGVLASSYAVVEDHRLAHWAFGPLRLFHSFHQLFSEEKSKEVETTDFQMPNSETATHLSTLTTEHKTRKYIKDNIIQTQSNFSKLLIMENQKEHSFQGWISDIHWYARLLYRVACLFLNANLFHP